MKSKRILSIDLFRGLTIFLMVFVNDLAGVSNIPAWMKHVPADVNGMTFVDVVFPAFLFIVGMAIPFAVDNRLAKGEGPLNFWSHVLTRTLGLIILGVYMVNSAEMNEEASLISKSLWAATLYVGAILIWNRYPKAEGSRKTIFNGLRILGVLALVALYFLYRKGTEGQITGMTPSWWGILGLIGWAYLLSMIAYMLSGRRLIPSIAWFGSILSILLVLRSDLIIMPHGLIWLKGQTGHIAHTLIVLAGGICALLLKEKQEDETPNFRIRNMLILAVVLALLGYFTQPFGGISKIGATPSWALFSAAICSFIFPMIYWLVDLKGISRWGAFLKPAGENPLLTYILPPLFYAIVGYGFAPDILSSGFPGFLKAIVFSLFILWIAALLSKRGIRLHL